MAAWKKHIDTITKGTHKLQHIVLWIPQVKVLIVWLIFLSGSFIHDFFPLSRSYFSNKKNIFNVLFVKKGWGWTCGILLLFILVRLAHQEVDIKTIWKHVLRLIHSTLAWFVLTTLFEQIESWSGHCEGNIVKQTKTDCLREQFKWNGFDISGHCFLLTFCILLINEELSAYKVGRSQATTEASFELWAFNQRTSVKTIQSAVLLALSISLTMLMILWEFMLFFTCIYFHTVLQKAAGTLIGIFAWYVIYNVAVRYQHPFMPATPKAV